MKRDRTNWKDEIRIQGAYEKQMEFDKWHKEIPEIEFPVGWKIKIVPPFAGAVVRFRVRKGTADISVYLDCYDKLGYFGEPYWEVYPHDGDIFRCAMNDTDKLLKAIQKSIDKEMIKITPEIKLLN